MEEFERFIISNKQLRALSRIESVRLASSVDVSGWEDISVAAEQILNEAGIKTVNRREFIEGTGDAMLLFKWAFPEDNVGIAQLILYTDMQIPKTDELQMSIVWISQSLTLIDMTNPEEVRTILLNEIGEFASAHQKACSLPG